MTALQRPIVRPVVTSWSDLPAIFTGYPVLPVTAPGEACSSDCYYAFHLSPPSGTHPLLHKPDLRADSLFALSPLTGVIAFVLGVIMAAAALAYSASGRINITGVWLLWAGLPLLGSLLAFASLFTGRCQPWLFRWRSRAVQWHPTPVERLNMLLAMQLWWLVAGVGLLCGFFGLLLFSDLAFGWRSTLIENPQQVVVLVQTLAAPWQSFWPAAVPDLALVETTRFIRIDPTPVDVTAAGSWWRFLLASLVCYNLLPRVLLAGIIYLRLRRAHQSRVQVAAPSFSPHLSQKPGPAEDLLANWQNAAVIDWELPLASGAGAALSLGGESWVADQSALRNWLMTPQEAIYWRVNARRSPVAELADLMSEARASGIQRQGLFAVSDENTDTERHLSSWRLFAAQHQLVWLQEANQ